jgi:hypothetical protein
VLVFGDRFLLLNPIFIKVRDRGTIVHPESNTQKTNRTMTSLGMTGNRSGLTQEAILVLTKFLETHKIEEAHHGDCIGADSNFHDVCLSKKIKLIIHPPIENKSRAFCQGATRVNSPKKYLKRNRDIVDTTSMLIAFPPTNEEVLRSGTWSTIRYAKKKSKPILIVYPDGKTNYLSC